MKYLILIFFCCPFSYICLPCDAIENGDGKKLAATGDAQSYKGHGFTIRCIMASEFSRSVVVLPDGDKNRQQTEIVFDFSMVNGSWALSGATFAGDLTGRGISAKLLARDHWGILLSGAKGIEGIFSLKEEAFGFYDEKTVEEYKKRPLPIPIPAPK